MYDMNKTKDDESEREWFDILWRTDKCPHLKAFGAIEGNATGVLQSLADQGVPAYILYHPLKLRGVLSALNHVHHHLSSTHLPQTLVQWAYLMHTCKDN